MNIDSHFIIRRRQLAVRKSPAVIENTGPGQLAQITVRGPTERTAISPGKSTVAFAFGSNVSDGRTFQVIPIDRARGRSLLNVPPDDRENAEVREHQGNRYERQRVERRPGLRTPFIARI